jgi:hypothetical protein
MLREMFEKGERLPETRKPSKAAKRKKKEKEKREKKRAKEAAKLEAHLKRWGAPKKKK